jgi:uncharacterized cupredoxin-like copper-binding protein
MRSRLTWLAVAALAAAAVLAGPASSRHTASFQINVTAKEFSFHLGRGGVPHGTRTVFHLINNGKLAHDFKIAGKKTPLLKPKGETTLVVTFTKKGSYPYVCTVPGHAAAGMKGVFHVF